MKVLVLTFEYPPFAGGIATCALTLAESLSEAGSRVRVLAPSYPGSAELDAGLASETVRIPAGHHARELVRFVPGTVHLRRHLRAFRPDVALLASDLAHGVGALVCPGARVPYVPVVHGSEIAKHFPARTLKQRLQAVGLRRAYRGAARVVCVSAYVRDLMVDAGFDPGRIEVIHNGIEGPVVRSPRDPAREAELRRRLGLGSRRVVLTFARLTPRKGQDTAIRALPSVLARHPDSVYVVAGAGPDEARLRALAAELGVGGAVAFAGRVAEEDKAALLDLCDVYLLPSRHEDQRVEGLGIALLEAAARGKPLVAGRHGGVPEIVEDGVNGFLVDPADAGAVAGAVDALLADPARREALGAAARRTVEERFLADAMVRRYREVLAAAAGV